MSCWRATWTRSKGASRTTRRSRRFCGSTSYRRVHGRAGRRHARRVQPAGDARRAGLSAHALARRTVSRVPVSDRHRPIAAVVARGRAAGDAAADRRPPARSGVRRRGRLAARRTSSSTRCRRRSRARRRRSSARSTAAGETVQLALGLAEIFGGEIDFNSDLQPGDRIDVLFERVHARRRVHRVRRDQGRGARERRTGGSPPSDFRMPTASPRGTTKTAARCRRQFLQSPLPFDPRVTSRFSYRRLHPVHGTTRAHLGVDYGAPAGTRVNAVASGVVELAGWAGEGGRIVRHASCRRLSDRRIFIFRRSRRASVRARASSRATAIGRVGSSGTATGPHLDYRIIRNGTYVNPIVELKKMPKGDPIAPGRARGVRPRRATPCSPDCRRAGHADVADCLRSARCGPAPETAAQVAAVPYDVVIDRRGARAASPTIRSASCA